METKVQDNISTMGSSAAATPKTRYSAKELGEMINTHPQDFLHVDIGLCTGWYTDDDYMEEMISYVKKEESIELLISYILLIQERQVCIEHHPKVCCRVKDSRKFAPYVEDLKEKLDAMHVRALHKREIEAKVAEMQSLWAASVSTASQEIIASVENSGTIINETVPPEFSEGTDENRIQYHLSDLPDDVQKHILIETDELYSQFVETMQGPVKEWIDKRHHLQDWNVVRFICRLRKIVTRKCSMNIFGKFLEKIGLGNQENNMKQRKDTNDENAMLIYDDPIKSQKIWKLKRDGKEIEAMLSDIIKSIAA